MTYTVKGRRPAQIDTHQATQMTRQLGGAGGIRPPEHRTALGYSEGDHDPRIGGQQGDYHSTGGMQLSMPSYQAGSPGKPFYGAHTPAPPADRTPPRKSKTRGYSDAIQRPQF